MKKNILLVLLVPILAIALISCDADMRSSFADFLGGLGGNVYVDGGLVEPNTADAKAATNTISGLGSGAGSSAVGNDDKIDEDVFGLAIDLSGKDMEGTTFMKPQKKDDQDKLKDELSSAFDSPSQTAALVEDLKKPVTDPGRKEAVQGTVEIFNEVVDAFIGDLKDDGSDDDLKEVLNNLKLDSVGNDDEITEADVLLVQMMANLVANTIETVKDDGGGGDDTDKILALVNDALFTAQVAEELSGAANIDFSGQLKLESLLEGLNKGSRTSRDGGDDDFDASEFLEIFDTLGPELINMIGLKKIGGQYNWASGDYRRFIGNQQAYRGAVEHALAFAGRKNQLGNLKNRGLVFDGSTAIKYLLSVIFTEMNEWGKSAGADKENYARVMIRLSIDANPWLATGNFTDDTDWEEPDFGNAEIDFEKFLKFLHDRGEDYLKAIFTNVKKINDVGGIKQLSDVIDEFLDDDFGEWYDELDN